jgi:hypothetical protein
MAWTLITTKKIEAQIQEMQKDKQKVIKENCELDRELAQVIEDIKKMFCLESLCHGKER